MEKSYQTQPLFLNWNITVLNSKSNIHRSEWRSMSFERVHQISAQSNHWLTLIEAHDQNCPDRKLTKTEALFLDWKKIVRNSKSDLHHSDWRSMSHEPLLQISGQSVHNEIGLDLWWNLDSEEKLSFFL